MALILKVGTRPSPLAFRQVDEIQLRLSGVILQKVPILTRGDKDKLSSLVGHQDSDFFTGEIERALLRGEIDAAVHSAKDLESNLPEELAVAAITPSLSRLDCLVSRKNLTLDALPSGACVASSSRKRQNAIMKYRPDLTVKDVRGDIGERLAQLERDVFDALVVAHAALLRLRLEYRIAQIIPQEIIPAHPLQGRIAVQVHRRRKDLLDIFRRLREE